MNFPMIRLFLVLLVLSTAPACTASKTQIPESPNIQPFKTPETVPPTNTPLPPSPTPSETPTPTRVPPTETPTFEPTRTLTPTPDLDVVFAQVFSEASIDFPTQLTTSYQDPNNKFGGSISFSEGLAKAANFSSTNFSEEFMRRMLLDVFGHIAYASLYSHPRYDAFQELMPPEHTDYYHYFGDIRFITLMEETFKETGLIVKIGSDYTQYGRQFDFKPIEIKYIHLNFIKMDEYGPLKDAFEKARVEFAVVPSDALAVRSSSQTRGLVIIENGSLYLFGYGNGTPGVDDRGFKPLEQSKNANDLKRLKGVQALIVSVEFWLSHLFLSPYHPNPYSISTGISVQALCADSLDNIKKYDSWIVACEKPAEGMFR